MLSKNTILELSRGYSIPMDSDELESYARDIERAVLAKASQQEQGEPEYHCLTCKVEHGVNGNCQLCGSPLSVVYASPKAMPAPKQQPVAELDEYGNLVWSELSSDYEICTGFKFYAAPPQSAAIPEGWQLVPIKPSNEVLDIAAESICGFSRQNAIDWVKEEKFDSYVDDAYSAYKAILDAAPKPEGE
jgi:hypothetical protein